MAAASLNSGDDVKTNPDDRSPIARAAAWSARILTVAMEMVLPGLLGYWLDEKLGTKVLFLLVGLMLGCTAATLHLVQMIRSQDRE